MRYTTPGRHRTLPSNGQTHPLLGPRSPLGDPFKMPTSPRTIHNWHVRVSSLRHHNWDFSAASRDAIFVLATTTHQALEDVGRSKASLRFALDLALKTPSPLSADIVNDTIELCDLVRNMHSARYSPNWFSKHIKKTRESRPRNRRVQFDSSVSDRSVGTSAAPPRRTYERQSEEQARHDGAYHGQRHGTRLPRGTGSGKATTKASNSTRLSRPRLPRFRAFIPPRIARPGAHTEMIRRIFVQRHGRPSERPCPTKTTFWSGPRTLSLHRSPST